MPFKYFIDISYLGTNYHGWQRQTKQLSIQEIIENCINKILHKNAEYINLYGSSRTDTGVHARQQIAHFTVQNQLDVKKLIYKLNCLLPKDISINKIKQVSCDFHSRFDALSRTYEYHISTIKDPFLDNTSIFINSPLDVEKMNEACKVLLTTTNFKAFCKSRSGINNYNCTIKEAFWKIEKHKLIFKITSNRFLRGMVRAIVGTLVALGKDKIGIKEFRNIVDSQDRTNAYNIDARGLTLVKVDYETV